MPASNSTATPSDAFAEFQAELQEIMRHKWLASEKAGHDVGFEQALREWSETKRAEWRRARREERAKA